MDEKRVALKSKKFNAVDLITVVVFAALVRVLWIVFKTAGVIFPFNHSFMQMFSAFCLVACVTVVKKRGAAFYYTVGWCAINFFLQGEHWIYWLLPVLIGIIPELFMNLRKKSFENPDDVYHSFKDVMVFMYIYNIIYFIFVFWTIIYIFLIPTPTNLMLAAFGLGQVLGFIGGFLGFKVGIKINSLIN